MVVAIVVGNSKTQQDCSFSFHNNNSKTHTQNRNHSFQCSSDGNLSSFLPSSSASATSIVKRQAESGDGNDAELCKGRPPSEYFRLTADEDCRDVVRCSVQGLLALRCPSGLAFDIDKQTCDWKSNVKNCQQLESK